MPAARVKCQAVLTHGPRLWDKIRVVADSAAHAQMMLGFVVRQCAVALGHAPTAAELADWANNQPGARGRYHIFGRAISIDEARVILRHPGRLVTVRPDGHWVCPEVPRELASRSGDGRRGR
jgi:hypothetical protein